MTPDRELTREDRYRFVSPSGKATGWRRVPRNGLSGVQYTRARRLLGEHFDLEIQETKDRSESR